MRDTILSNIRQSLNSAQALPYAHTPIPPHSNSDRQSLITQFESEWLALGGQFERVKNADAVERAMDLLREKRAQRILAWEPDSLPVALATLPQAVRGAGMILMDAVIPREAASRCARTVELETADVGITGADGAIAQVGGVAVKSGPGRSRLASLIVPTHVIFVTPDQFYPTLESWWSNVGGDPSSVTLIAGPSRTSDIERVLTLGVHGPKEAIVVCIE